MIKSNTIENKFLRVRTLNIGATLFEVFYKKKKINLILNLGNISSYKNNKNYLGATCGRYANRIRNSQFKIKGVNYKLTRNEGKNILKPCLAIKHIKSMELILHTKIKKFVIVLPNYPFI